MGWTEEQRQEWRDACQRQRIIARTCLCADAAQSLDPQYTVRHHMEDQEWAVGLTLELINFQPVWHGWVSVLQDLPMQRGTWGAPERRYLPTHLWQREHFDNARDLLGDVFGPLIRPKDDQQEAHESKGNTSLHWLIPFDAEQEKLFHFLQERAA